MIQIISQRHSELSAPLRDALGRYRHAVFIEQMGWDVTSTSPLPGREFDQFDHPGTRYIIALDRHGQVQGCARLLPTVEPYLLGDVFDYLCDQPPPANRQTWEISRFAARAEQDPQLAMRVFWSTLHAAWELGASAVVAVTTASLERYFQRNGVVQQRLGPARKVKGECLVALHFDAWQPGGVSALGLGAVA
ncbi:acyl-homoserine-lactone synthase [Pseudomonas sp. TE3610]